MIINHLIAYILFLSFFLPYYEIFLKIILKKTYGHTDIWTDISNYRVDWLLKIWKHNLFGL